MPGGPGEPGPLCFRGKWCEIQKLYDNCTRSQGGFDPTAIPGSLFSAAGAGKHHWTSGVHDRRPWYGWLLQGAGHGNSEFHPSKIRRRCGQAQYGFLYLDRSNGRVKCHGKHVAIHDFMNLIVSFPSRKIPMKCHSTAILYRLSHLCQWQSWPMTSFPRLYYFEVLGPWGLSFAVEHVECTLHHLEPAVWVKPCQISSEIIRIHQRSSEIIRDHQNSSEIIRDHQRSSASLSET